jgi:hypothetical protein
MSSIIFENRSLLHRVLGFLDFATFQTCLHLSRTTMMLGKRAIVYEHVCAPSITRVIDMLQQHMLYFLRGITISIRDGGWWWSNKLASELTNIQWSQHVSFVCVVAVVSTIRITAECFPPNTRTCHLSCSFYGMSPQIISLPETLETLIVTDCPHMDANIIPSSLRNLIFNETDIAKRRNDASQSLFQNVPSLPTTLEWVHLPIYNEGYVSKTNGINKVTYCFMARLYGSRPNNYKIKDGHRIVPVKKKKDDMIWSRGLILSRRDVPH